jgi:hypothetical protein|tara:strand:+ start:280 stop:750 length:471 start_codon:yes stop_codon:yes gene_type:complete
MAYLRKSAGNVIQTVSSNEAFGGASISTGDSGDTDDDVANGFEITNVSAGNILVAIVSGGHAKYQGSTINRYCHFRIGFSPDTGSDTFFDGIAVRLRTTGFYFHVPITISASYTIPAGVTSVKVLRRITLDHNDSNIAWESDQTSGVSCTITEILQ